MLMPMLVGPIYGPEAHRRLDAESLSRAISRSPARHRLASRAAAALRRPSTPLSELSQSLSPCAGGCVLLLLLEAWCLGAKNGWRVYCLGYYGSSLPVASLDSTLDLLAGEIWRLHIMRHTRFI